MQNITSIVEANRFLREHYLAEFNRHFQVPAAQRGTAFTACPRRDLNLIFSLQFERTVARDNTVSFQNMTLQIDKVNWRGTLAGCTVIVHRHLDRTLSITYGPPGWGITPLRAVQSKPFLPRKLLKRRMVEKSRNGLSRHAWKSRRLNGIPTFQQLRRRRDDQHKPEISFATKTGHLNLLTTQLFT